MGSRRPPKGDLLGPGTRIPAIIISPIAKAGTVDHTQYDTGSILRLITRRFQLDTLPGLTQRDNALTKGGGQPMADLTSALALSHRFVRSVSAFLPRHGRGGNGLAHLDLLTPA